MSKKDFADIVSAHTFWQHTKCVLSPSQLIEQNFNIARGALSVRIISI